MDILSEFRNKRVHKRDIMGFVNLRLAHVCDDEDLGSFLLRTFSDAHSRFDPENPPTCERIAELLNTRTRRENGMTKILELGRRIIGTYSLLGRESLVSEGWSQEASYFSSFAIDPSMQGMGFAPLMMMDALHEALGQGYQAMELHVTQSAKKLLDFYGDYGFVRDPKGDSFRAGQALYGMRVELSFAKTSDLLKAI